MRGDWTGFEPPELRAALTEGAVTEADLDELEDQIAELATEGVTVVTVLEDGYQYGDRVYKSLSAIARQATGTQWNGYVFFGLRLRQEQGRAE